jgi:hypothetical protein
MGTYNDFKIGTIIDIGDSGFWHIVTMVPWEDTTGGFPVQYGYKSNLVYRRYAASTGTWNEWQDISNSSATGATGPMGSAGAQGVTGATGPTGASIWSLNGANTYYTTGSVGVGTSSPAVALHVHSTGDQARMRLSSTYASRIDYFNYLTSASSPQWTVINDYNQNQTNELRFLNSSGNTNMTLTQDGNVGVGTTASSSCITAHRTGSYSYITIKGDDAQPQGLEFYDSSQRWVISKLASTTNLGFWNGSSYGLMLNDVSRQTYSAIGTLLLYSDPSTNPGPALSITGNSTKFTKFTVGDVLTFSGNRVRYDANVSQGSTSTTISCTITSISTDTAITATIINPVSINYYNTGGVYVSFTWTGGASNQAGGIRVGVNNSSPSYTMHVSRPAALDAITADSTILYVNGNVTASGSFVSSSDVRIKENITTTDTSEALSIIDAIPLRTYNYIDRVEDGDEKVYGVLAQEVKAVLPEAVFTETDYVPNIYKYADSLVLEEDANVRINLICDILKGDSVKLSRGGYIFEKTVVDKDTFGNWFKVEQWENFSENDKILVHGTRVTDFERVDKLKLAMVSIGAIQQLNKYNTAMIERIETLEKANQEVLARLQDVTNALTELKTN